MFAVMLDTSHRTLDSASQQYPCSPLQTTTREILSSKAETTDNELTVAPHYCACSCSEKFIKTQEEIASALHQIKNRLFLNKSTLSSYRRTKISADDDRVSSVTIGYFGVAILTCFVLIIAMLDFQLLFLDR